MVDFGTPFEIRWALRTPKKASRALPILARFWRCFSFLDFFQIKLFREHPKHENTLKSVLVKGKNTSKKWFGRSQNRFKTWPAWHRTTSDLDLTNSDPGLGPSCQRIRSKLPASHRNAQTHPYGYAFLLLPFPSYKILPLPQRVRESENPRNQRTWDSGSLRDALLGSVEVAGSTEQRIGVRPWVNL